MEHIIQMAISVEDEKIVKKVEETAENQIIQTLTDRVENVISEKKRLVRKTRKGLHAIERHGVGTNCKDFAGK